MSPKRPKNTDLEETDELRTDGEPVLSSRRRLSRSGPNRRETNEVLEHRLTQAEEKIKTQKHLLIQNREMLIEIAGKSGKNGMISHLINEISELEKKIDELQTTFDKQRSFVFKLVLSMMMTSGVGAGIAQAIISAMNG